MNVNGVSRMLSQVLFLKDMKMQMYIQIKREVEQTYIYVLRESKGQSQGC